MFEKLFNRFGFNGKAESLGQYGERLAIKFLKKKGYIIVAQGQRERFGETDIIAVQRPTIVFVEVKTRSTSFAGAPVEAVDQNKQRKLTRAAEIFIKRHDLGAHPIRFDIVSINVSDSSSKKRTHKIEHFENAFEAANLNIGTV